MIEGEDGPDAWREMVPSSRLAAHKHARGHVLVVSGPEFRTGAARLAARAAARGGAGLVTIAGDAAALRVHAARVDAIMLAEAATPAAVEALLLAEPRYRVVVLGPAAGVGPDTIARTRAVARAGRALVLDADGLTSLVGRVSLLAGVIRRGGGPVVLTPHEGEFERLFGPVGPDRPAAALAAAAATGAVVVLKGPRTAIAAPDGRVATSGIGPPWLATAGTGDVLAGLIAAMLARGAPVFEAARAGVWVHGMAARAFGPGLIADDLPDLVPGVLASLEGVS